MNIDIDIVKKFNSQPDILKLINNMTTETVNKWIIDNNDIFIKNIKYKIDFSIDSNSRNPSHPSYSFINATAQNNYRIISSNKQLVDFINNHSYHKKYNNSALVDRPWVYNEESFYKNYPEFDLTYYKNRYRKNINETTLDTLAYYHTTGRLNRHANNNKYTIVFYSPLYSSVTGGIKCMYNMAKCINEIKSPTIQAKMFGIHNKTYTNPYCNEIIYYHELHDNCIALYPEIIRGNPLNCKYVVRWILLALGIETPHSVKDTWGKNDIIYHWEAPPIIGPNILRKHIIDTIFTRRNPNRRSYNCVLIKKGRLINSNTLNRHPKKSILLDTITEDISSFKEEQICKIFNSCRFLFTYDIKTMWIIYALLCGCAVVILPPNKIKISEGEFFKQSIFNYEGTVYRDGISWGRHKPSMYRALCTVNNQVTKLHEIFANEYKYIHNFLNDINTKIK